MGYQLQPSSNTISKQRPIQIHTPTPVLPKCMPKVLVPNSSMSSVGQPSPALSMPTSFGVAKEDVGSPSQDQKLLIVKLDLTQSRHSKAVLRKELKKDVQMNGVFEEIHVDFYLLAITENLFIENSMCFKPVIRQLAHESFTRLCVTPFNISDNFIATVSYCYFIHSCWLTFYQFAHDLKSWRHKLKRHLLTVIPPFYSIGSSVDRGVTKDNVDQVLMNGNFAFQSYNVMVSTGFSF